MLQHFYQSYIVHDNTNTVKLRNRVSQASRPAWIINVGLSNFNSSPDIQDNLEPKRKKPKPVQREGFIKLSTNIELAKDHSFAINEMIGVLLAISEQHHTEDFHYSYSALSKENSRSGFDRDTVAKYMKTLEQVGFLQRLGKHQSGVIKWKLNLERIHRFYNGDSFYPLQRRLMTLPQSQRHVMAFLLKRWSKPNVAGYRLVTDTTTFIADRLCLSKKQVRRVFDKLREDQTSTIRNYVWEVSDDEKESIIGNFKTVLQDGYINKQFDDYELAECVSKKFWSGLKELQANAKYRWLLPGQETEWLMNYQHFEFPSIDECFDQDNSPEDHQADCNRLQQTN